MRSETDAADEAVFGPRRKFLRTMEAAGVRVAGALPALERDRYGFVLTIRSEGPERRSSRPSTEIPRLRLEEVRGWGRLLFGDVLPAPPKGAPHACRASRAFPSLTKLRSSAPPVQARNGRNTPQKRQAPPAVTTSPDATYAVAEHRVHVTRSLFASRMGLEEPRESGVSAFWTGETRSRAPHDVRASRSRQPPRRRVRRILHRV